MGIVLLYFTLLTIPYLLLDKVDCFVHKVPDSSFQILVDYMSGTRGHAKQMIVEKTMKVIKAVELWSKLSEEGLKEEDIANQVPDGKIPEVMYERARSVLQSLDDV
jgi:hypothetical protein